MTIQHKDTQNQDTVVVRTMHLGTDHCKLLLRISLSDNNATCTLLCFPTNAVVISKETLYKLLGAIWQPQRGPGVAFPVEVLAVCRGQKWLLLMAALLGACCSMKIAFCVNTCISAGCCTWRQSEVQKWLSRGVCHSWSLL